MATIKEKPKYNTAQNVVWMLEVAWKTPRKRVPFICLLAAALDVLLQVVQLYVAPEILSAVETHVPLGKLLQTILFFTAALLLLRGVKRYIKENTMFPRIDVRVSVMEMISKKCMVTSYSNTLDADFLKLRDTANIACQSNDKATEHIWQTLTELLKNVGGFLVFLTILSRLELPLLLLMTATCVASFCVSAYSKNRIFARREEEERYYQKKYYLRRSAASVEMAKDIRIFGLQDWLNALLDSVHDLYLDFRLKCERVELLADLTEALLTVARNAIAYVYLIRMALLDGLSVSEFLLYFNAVSGFTQWVMGILQETDTLRKECMDIARIREFLEFPEPFRFAGGEPIPEAERYELRLEHVSFRYSGAERDILSDFDLTVRAGEKLAVVGLNGAGKTTLVKLLCGLLDPTSGRVLLNGRDIRDFDRRDYYRLFGAVFQEYSVLPVSVEENIAQAALIDPQRMSDCLEKAGLREAIEALPNGTKTHLGREIYLDGVLFSGGQTQRLMLARALYRDAPILLLDEPTAALDPLAESDIYEKYSAMTQGKTSLFISHRLASTRFCDRILLIADGKIAEEGTHESLLARGGKYASLFEVQSRYYREGKEF